jgi:hypothetical protein
VLARSDGRKPGGLTTRRKGISGFDLPRGKL